MARVLYRDDRLQLEVEGEDDDTAELVLRGCCVVCQQVLHESRWPPGWWRRRRLLIVAQAQRDAAKALGHRCVLGAK